MMQVIVVEDNQVYNPVALEIPKVDLSSPLVEGAVKILGIEKMYGCLISDVDPQVSADMFNDVQILTPYTD